ncbi:MAG TPA: DinB family protein [Terriglobia bacterium]|nr:DinB family protein [Terriglobia bacterium]
MKTAGPDPARPFLALAEHSLRRHHLPRVEACFKRLSEEQIWWRPNDASNSAGNLALHLAGNVRQWLVAGLGGAPDERQRDREFSERGPLPPAQVVRALRQAVLDACRVLRRLTPRDLARTYSIQGMRVSGLNAALHVVEHFAFHTGQIVALTKQQEGRDLGFTRLPGGKRRKQAARALPVL